VAAELSYPVAYGVTRETAERIGAWWEEHRGIVQPAELLVGANGKVMASTYRNAPSGTSLSRRFRTAASTVTYRPAGGGNHKSGGPTSVERGGKITDTVSPCWS
jgi:hypothetical protein